MNLGSATCGLDELSYTLQGECAPILPHLSNVGAHFYFRPHFVIMTAIATIVFVTCIVFLVDKRV